MIEINNKFKGYLCLYLVLCGAESVAFSFWAAGGSSDMGLIVQIRSGFLQNPSVIQIFLKARKGGVHFFFIEFCEVTRESAQVPPMWS